VPTSREGSKSKKSSALWQAFERRARLLTSVDIFASATDPNLSLVGMSFTNLRVSPSLTMACLVIRNAVYLINLPVAGSSESLMVKEIEPPFASAIPSIVAVSHTTLWSFWSGAGREQLFSYSLEPYDGASWTSRALFAVKSFPLLLKKSHD